MTKGGQGASIPRIAEKPVFHSQLGLERAPWEWVNPHQPMQPRTPFSQARFSCILEERRGVFYRVMVIKFTP